MGLVESDLFGPSTAYGLPVALELKTGGSPLDPGALIDVMNIVMPAFWSGQEIECRSCSRVCMSFACPGLGIRKDGIPFKKETHEGDVFEPSIQR